MFVLPTFDQTTSDMIVPAAMIAIVGFLETIAVGGKMANEKRYGYDANQELLALGAANIGGAFMAAFPITGGFSRTAVNAMFLRIAYKNPPPPPPAQKSKKLVLPYKGNIGN